MNYKVKSNSLLEEGLNIPKLDWFTMVNRNTLLIVDLPEKEGIEEAITLAEISYRPVPLYIG